MASTTHSTTTLCQWVYSTHYEDLPAEVRQETVTLRYDQVGCMLASATLPSCTPPGCPQTVQHRGACAAHLSHQGGPGQRHDWAW